MIKAPISVQSMQNQLLTLLTPQQKKIHQVINDIKTLSQEFYILFNSIDLLLNDKFFFQISDRNINYPYLLVNGFQLKYDRSIESNNNNNLQITLNNPNHIDFRMYDLESNNSIYLKKFQKTDTFAITIREFISTQLSLYDFDYKPVMNERYHTFSDIFSLVNTLGSTIVQDLELLNIKTNQYLPNKKDSFYTLESFHNQLLKHKDILELNYDIQLPNIDTIKKQTYKKS